jgi:hypothetical protein
MATIDLTFGNTTKHPSNHSQRTPYFVWDYIDFAEATTSKGSALAAADVIQVLDIPAGTLVMNAGMTVVEAFAGTSTGLALDLGITGVEADNFIDGFDFDAAVVGDHALPPAAFQPLVVGAAADTLDILIQAQDGTFTAGEVIVWALLCDINPPATRPGIALLGS